MRIRPINSFDEQFLFILNNDPVIRAMSVSMDPIKRVDHSHWFKKLMVEQKSRPAFIVEDYIKEPIGCVRFEILADGESAEISLVLNKDYMHAIGWSSRVVMDSIEALQITFKVREIIAGVKPWNIALIQLYDNLGFAFTEVSDHCLLRPEIKEKIMVFRKRL